jgi:hypothetical protein
MQVDERLGVPTFLWAGKPGFGDAVGWTRQAGARGRRPPPPRRLREALGPQGGGRRGREGQRSP